MVRVRRQNTNGNSSIPLRNPGVRRRSLLREEHTRNNLPQIAFGFNQSNSNLTTLFEIPPNPLSTPGIIPNYEGSSAEQEYILPDYEEPRAEGEYILPDYEELFPRETTHDDLNDGSLWEVNPAPPALQITIEPFFTWDQETAITPTPRTHDKGIQYPEIPLVPVQSNTYTREYSPVNRSYPRWYLLPEEDPDQIINNSPYFQEDP